ncbi:MAG: pitrilysin family protein [Kofleriaceae bacterium]
MQRAIGDARVALAFHAPPAAAAELAELELAVAVLGGRDPTLGDVRGRHHVLRDGGLVVLDALVEPGAEAAAGAALARRVVELPRTLTPARLEAARAAVCADHAFQRETVQGVARELGWRLCTFGDVDVGEGGGRLTGLGRDQVLAAAARTLLPERASVVAVTPRRVTARGAAGRSLLARLPRRRPIAPAVVAAPVVAAAAPTKPRPAPSTAPPIVREVLGNGLTVIIKPDPTVPVVAMRAMWQGGSRLEDATTSGTTSLLATMLVRGCGRLDADALEAAVDGLGGALGAVAGRNSLALRAEWSSQTWERGLELLAGCVAAPRFDAAELRRQRRAQLDQLALEDTYPTHVAFRTFAEALYAQHPYRLRPLGDPTVVAGLDRATLARTYRDRYPRSAMTLAIVGDVDPARALALVEAHLGAASPPPPPPPTIALEAFDAQPSATREVYRYLDRQQASVVVGFPGTTLGASDRFAVEALVQLLGGHSGRLFAELRERQGLAYQVSMYGADGLDPGYLAVYVACAPANADRVVALVRAELERVVAEGVAADEVERARRRLVGGHQLALQRRAAIASALAYHDVHGLGWQEWSRYPAHLAAVTTAEVTAAARRYLRWDRAVVAVVRPPSATPGAARRTQPRTGKRR